MKREDIRARLQSKELTTQEFIDLWRNIQKLLQKRAQEAKKKADAHPGDIDLFEQYVDRTKELFSYLRLMIVAGSLGREVIALKDMLLLKEIESANAAWSQPDSKKSKPN